MLKTTSITKVKIRSKNTAHVHVHLYSFQGFLFDSNEAYFNEGQEHEKMCTAKISNTLPCFRILNKWRRQYITETFILF